MRNTSINLRMPHMPNKILIRLAAINTPFNASPIQTVALTISNMLLQIHTIEKILFSNDEFNLFMSYNTILSVINAGVCPINSIKLLVIFA